MPRRYVFACIILFREGPTSLEPISALQGFLFLIIYKFAKRYVVTLSEARGILTAEVIVGHNRLAS